MSWDDGEGTCPNCGELIEVMYSASGALVCPACQWDITDDLLGDGTEGDDDDLIEDGEED